MSDLDKYRAEQLQDPEFKEYYDKMQAAAALSKAVVAMRLDLGLTQKDLSRLTGMTQSEISRIEACDTNPTFKTLNRIASAVNMRVKIEFVPQSGDED